MGASAIYAASPASFSARIDTANTNMDGTGAIVDVCSAGVNGTRIDDVTIVAVSTTTAGMVRLFLNNGTTSFLWKEIPVTPITPSSTVPAWSITLLDLALVIKSGWKLQASTHNAEAFNVLGIRAGDI